MEILLRKYHYLPSFHNLLSGKQNKDTIKTNQLDYLTHAWQIVLKDDKNMCISISYIINITLYLWVENKEISLSLDSKEIMETNSAKFKKKYIHYNDYDEIVMKYKSINTKLVDAKGSLDELLKNYINQDILPDIEELKSNLAQYQKNLNNTKEVNLEIIKLNSNEIFNNFNSKLREPEFENIRKFLLKEHLENSLNNIKDKKIKQKIKI